MGFSCIDGGDGKWFICYVKLVIPQKKKKMPGFITKRMDSTDLTRYMGKGVFITTPSAITNH